MIRLVKKIFYANMLTLLCFNSDVISNSIDSVNYYKQLGYNSYLNGEYSKSEMYYEKTLSFINKDSISMLAKQLFNLGTIKIEIQKLDEGFELLEKALYLTKTFKKDKEFLQRLYGCIGSYYLEKGEFSYSIDYYLNSNKLINETMNEGKYYHETSLMTNYYNIGLAYYYSGNTIKAIDYFKKSISNTPSEYELDITYPLLKIAQIYSELGDTIIANKTFEQLHKLAKKHNNNYSFFTEVFYQYSLFNLSLNKYNQAYNNLYLSLNLAKKHYGTKSYKVAKSYVGFGIYYEMINNFSIALKSYQKALVSLVDGFNDSLGYSNPTTVDVIDNLLYMKILKKKAALLNHMGKEDIQYYKKSLETYDLCIEAMEYLKKSYMTTEGKLFLAEMEKKTYILAIDEAFNLFTITGDNKYLENMFRHSEKIKSSILISAIKENEALQISDIPEELLLKESELKKSISILEATLHEEKNIIDGDQDKISNLEQKIFDAKNEFNILRNRFEKEFPNYFKLKYDDRIIEAKDIRNELKQNEILLEYTIKDSVMFIFSISKNDVIIKKATIDLSFYEKLNKLREGLSSINNTDVWEDMNEHDFIELSNYFYKTLILPFENEIKNKKIIIIPDELLAGLPFEILVKEYPQTGQLGFRNFPYLITTNTINYAYSATLLFDNSQQKTKNKKVLTIAPEYGKTVNYPADDPFIKRQQKTILNPLPGAQYESQNISKIFDGKTFLKNEASETNFKMFAGDFSILHLAAHTLIDDSKPLFSKIVFSHDTLKDDGYLNTYELYNLKLNAEMTVLSACRSGSGKLQEGEGIMSMARGFIYAGCKSIVFTLWEIDDLSTSRIIIDFYKYLSKGYRKDDALRLAKLNFIAQSDNIHVHPYFWSAIVLNGNSENLFMKTSHRCGIFTFIILFIALGIFALIKYRRTFYNLDRLKSS